MAEIEVVEVLVPGLQGPIGPAGAAGAPGAPGGDVTDAAELPTTDDGAFSGADVQTALELIYEGKQPLASRLTAIVATGIDTTMFASGAFDSDITLAANSATRVPSQSAVKGYIDNLLTGLKWKASVLCKTTGNVTLSGEQTIDGVLTSASRVLVGSQTAESENGIYVSSAGAWSRSADADSGDELVQATCFVEQGSIYGDTQWTCANDAITLGSTEVVFAQVSGAGTYSAGLGLALTGNQFAATGALATLAGLSSVANLSTVANLASVGNLTALQGLTLASDKLPYGNGSGTLALADFTAAGRALLDDADAAAQRATLGLGTSAVVDTGTSGAAVPLLNGANTWSGVQTLAADLLFSADNARDIGAQGATRPRAGYFGTSLQIGSRNLSADIASSSSLYINRPNGTAIFAANTTSGSPASGASLYLASIPGAALAAGSRLGGVVFQGAISSSGSRQAAGIAAFAAENWSASKNGARLEFGTATNGGTVITTKAILADSGMWVLGAAEDNTVPALKPSGAVLQARLGDDSADAGFQCGHLKATGSQIDFTGLPTSDPAVSGRLWSNSGVLTVSAG